MVAGRALRLDRPGSRLRQLHWSLVDWRKDEALVHVRERSVKVLTLVHRAIVVVLAVHHLEVILEALLNLLDYVALGRIWVNRLSSLPVVPKLKIGKRLACVIR